MSLSPHHEHSRGQERLLTPALSSTEEEREKLARGGWFMVAMRAKNSGNSHSGSLVVDKDNTLPTSCGYPFSDKLTALVFDACWLGPVSSSWPEPLPNGRWNRQQYGSRQSEVL